MKWIILTKRTVRRLVKDVWISEHNRGDQIVFTNSRDLLKKAALFLVDYR